MSGYQLKWWRDKFGKTKYKGEPLIDTVTVKDMIEHLSFVSGEPEEACELALMSFADYIVERAEKGWDRIQINSIGHFMIAGTEGKYAAWKFMPHQRLRYKIGRDFNDSLQEYIKSVKID